MINCGTFTTKEMYKIYVTSDEDLQTSRQAAAKKKGRNKKKSVKYQHHKTKLKNYQMDALQELMVFRQTGINFSGSIS